MTPGRDQRLVGERFGAELDQLQHAGAQLGIGRQGQGAQPAYRLDHLGRGVVAQLGLRGVAAAAGGVEAQRGPALLRHAQPQAGRLAGDHQVGRAGIEHVAERRAGQVLLAHRGRHDQRPRQAGERQGCPRADHGREAALGVGRAAAPQPPLRHLSAVGVMRPRLRPGVHDIHVAVEEQGGAGLPPPAQADHVAPRVHVHILVPAAAHRFGHARGHRALAPRGAGQADEGTGQGEDVRGHGAPYWILSC